MPWYVYGVTRPTATPVPIELPGVDDAPVQVVGSGDLQVVASEVPDSFDDLAAAPDDEILDAVQRHDAVLHEAARHRSLLPVRFGTVLADGNAVEDLLADTDGRLHQALDRVVDADEWVVTVSVEAGDDRPAPVDDHLRPGHAFFAQRQAAATQRQQYRADAIDLARDLDARFRDIARDFRALELRDPHTVARGAYLVPRDASDRFVDAARSDGAARVAVQGPLPPYRFAEVEP